MNLLYQRHWKTKLSFNLLIFLLLPLIFYSCGTSTKNTKTKSSIPYSYVYIPEEENINEIRNYFRDELQSKIDIYVLPSTYAEFNPIGGIADGRYNLVNYRITKLDNNIYKLELVFRKKKGLFTFVERVTYIFYYDGSVIAFKTIKGKRKFKIPKNIGSRYYFINVVLPAPKRGKVYLRLKLKAPHKYQRRNYIRPKPFTIPKNLRFEKR
jgi:hypothetical protein